MDIKKFNLPNDRSENLDEDDNQVENLEEDQELDQDEEEEEQDYEDYKRYKKSKKYKSEEEKKNGIGCKNIFMIILLSLLVFVAYVLVAKPVGIINAMKSVVNSEYGNEIPKYDNVQIDLTKLLSTADGKIEFNENELHSLLDNYLPGSIDRVEIEEGKIIIFRNLAKDNYPLWFAIEIEIVDGNYKITRSGFGLVAMPEKLNEKVFEKALTQITDDSGLFDKFAGHSPLQLLLPQNIKPTKDKLIITIIPNDQSQGITIDDLNEFFKSYME